MSVWIYATSKPPEFLLVSRHFDLPQQRLHKLPSRALRLGNLTNIRSLCPKSNGQILNK